MDKYLIPYSVGALLYAPAVYTHIASSVMEGRFGSLYSLALCLEDSIGDNAVDAALGQITRTFRELYEWQQAAPSDHILPKIFVRVRTPEQMLPLYERLAEAGALLTGFIFPKYFIDCSEQYIRNLMIINRTSGHIVYMMPIIEHSSFISPDSRYRYLCRLKAELDDVRSFVLNVRVGGNDLCKQFGVRRPANSTIYSILPVADILNGVLTVFSTEYVVSGPVWEYFSGESDEWKTGLIRELRRDILNGFIGKTVIHPNQIPIVNEQLRVSRNDYEDAKLVTGWSHDHLQVGKNVSGERMNEVKTHDKWAVKILKLAEIYGINEGPCI